MRRLSIVILLVVVIVIVVAASISLRETDQFRERVIGVLRDYSGTSYLRSTGSVGTKYLKGVFMGLEDSTERIGQYEYREKATFAGIDKNGELFYYRTPVMMTQDRKSFFQPGQFWETSQMVASDVNIVNSWREIKPGQVYYFLISPDIGAYFAEYDGGDPLMFENKILGNVYEISKLFVEKHTTEYGKLLSEDLEKGGVYDVIAMSRGQMMAGQAVSVPIGIRVSYLLAKIFHDN